MSASLPSRCAAICSAQLADRVSTSADCAGNRRLWAGERPARPCEIAMQREARVDTPGGPGPSRAERHVERAERRRGRRAQAGAAGHAEDHLPQSKNRIT